MNDIWRSKDTLVIRKNTKLPNRCIKTNQSVNVQRKLLKLSWVPSYIILFLLLSPLVYLIVFFCVKKDATLEIGVSDVILNKRKRLGLVGFSGLILGGIITMIPILNIGNLHLERHPNWLLIILLTGLTLLGAGFMAFAERKYFRISKIDEEYIWVAGVNNDYLSSFPDWENRGDG